VYTNDALFFLELLPTLISKLCEKMLEKRGRLRED
jgi:hypothetical protein